MNFELARNNMVAQQLRTWDVLDEQTLQAFAAIPREHFMPSGWARLAYSDTGIPIGCGQYTMAPKTEARMLQALALRPTDHALEIGTGCGFVTALLSRACRLVTSIEIEAPLHEAARERLSGAWGRKVRLHLGDGINGWPSEGPYDVIAVTGSVGEVPEALLAQLAPGGRLFIVTGREPVMEAQLVTRVDGSDFAVESLFETVLAPLKGAEPQPRFRL
jgi:protein-L-isoaspartate(D-aspartate) O-methyltransferase